MNEVALRGEARVCIRTYIGGWTDRWTDRIAHWAC